MKNWTLISLILGLSFSSICYADDPPNPEEVAKAKTDVDKKTTKEVTNTLDLSVPESPAFVILGVSPTTVTRPNSLREFSSSLIKDVDDKENLKDGLAVDIALNNLVKRGGALTLGDYRSDSFLRFLRNTHLSIATTQGQKEDKTLRLAIGLHTLMEQGDPAFSEELDDAYAKAFKARDLARAKAILDVSKVENQIKLAEQELHTATPEQIPAIQRKLADLKLTLDELKSRHLKLQSEFDAEVKKEFQKARPRLENKPVFSFSAAPCWISPDGRSSQLKADGYGAWLSYSVGVDGKKLKDGEYSRQFIFHARIRTKESIADENDATKMVKQDSSLIGLRYRVGGPDLKFSAEVATVTTKVAGQGRKNSQIFGLVFEPHISQDVWASFGLTRDTSGRSGPVGFRTSFKYGFN